LTTGATLQFVQSDNRSSGAVVYRLQMRERLPERLIVAFENVSPVKSWVVTRYGAGVLRTVVFFHHVSRAEWSFYGIWGIPEAGRFLGNAPTASYVNRAIALFRHVAGIPPTREPPAAPR